MRHFRALTTFFLAATLLLSSAPIGAADTWLDVRSENFVVISNAGDRKARLVAWQFEQVRAAIRSGFPWAVVNLDRPVVVIAVKDENSMRALAPEFWETRGGTRPGSVFVTGRDRHYIALRADVEVENQGLNPYSQAYWAYSALLLNTNFEYRLPLWLTNGLASLLSNTIVREKEIHFGSPIPWLVETARTAPLLPMPELLGITRESPYFRQQLGRERFDAQSWSLVQFLMFGAQSGAGAKLNQLTQRLLAGADSVSAVQEVYGSLDALEQAYRLYVHQGAFRFGRLAVNTDTSRDKYPVKAMADGEAAFARAGFHVATGRAGEATKLIAEGRAADATLPTGDELEALIFDRENKTNEARTAYAKAVQAGSTNYWVHYRLATLDASGPVDDAAVARAITGLERATTLNPGFAPAFQYLAFMQAQSRQFDRAAESAHRAATLSPQDVGYRISLARLLLSASKRTDAVQVATEALPLARTEQERSQLQAVIAAARTPTGQ